MKMTLKLNAPGMTGLHKAGLAGLYMTLQAFDETNQKISGLTWELEPTQVRLVWHDEKPKAAFEELTKLAFKLDDNGLIQFAGLEIAKPLTILQKYHVYNALLLSFLQYGKHRKKGKEVLLGDSSDDRFKVIDREFEPITLYRHQEVISRKIFIDGDGLFHEAIEVPSWMFPGGIKRHDVHNETKLKEPINLAIVLLFAPIGVVYYAIRSRAKGRKALLALLVPNIENLEEYSEFRQIIASAEVLEMHASSASDAALRFLTSMAGRRIRNQFEQMNNMVIACRVITFGIVGWSEQQKTRTYARSIITSQIPGLTNYQRASAIFKNHWQTVPAKRDRKGNETEPERHFVSTPSALEFIADNIANRDVWYHGLATYLSHEETREQLQYERKELHEMVETATYDDESERLFIRVCHESWRRRLGKLGERARQERIGDGGFQRLASKEAEKLRSSFTSCKNLETLRETVVDFWARGGANELLRGEQLTQVLTLFNERNWKKARDLALLALISYPQAPQDGAASSAAPGTTEGGNNE